MKVVPLDQIPKCSDAPANAMELYKVCIQMQKLCMEEHGIGLAAAQVGIPWRLFVAIHPDDYGKENQKYEYFINCDYVGLDDKKVGIEGCLSLKDKNGVPRMFEVDRYQKIHMTGLQLIDEDGMPELQVKPIDRIVDGLYAIIYQHEIDHAYGLDRMIHVIGKEITI